MNVLEHLLHHGVAPNRVLTELAHRLLEALVRTTHDLGRTLVGLPAIGFGLPAIGLRMTSLRPRLDPQIAQLFQDPPDAQIEVPSVLSVGHGHNIATLD